MSEGVSRDEWFRLLGVSLEAAAHAVVITNAQGEIIWTNPAFEELTGYRQDEVLGKNPKILNSGVHDDEFYENLWATITSGETWRGEILNRRKDGSVYPERQSIRPVYGDHGKISHYIAIKEDISGPRELQAQIKEMDRLLAIGTLAAGVAHEINNPLAYVRANLDFLFHRMSEVEGVAVIEGVSKQEAQEAINDALEGVERIEKVVSGLRSLSSKDELSQDTEEVALEEAVESAIKMVYSQIQERALLVRNFDPNPQRVIGIESKLVQVFVNLLINATQAIALGAPRGQEIRVATSYHENQAVLEVSDTGAGISAEVLPYIFDSFYSTKSKSDGVGLGLSICERIVKGLGGELKVESEVGVGTTFRVILEVHS